jgi:hypothetical protein
MLVRNILFIVFLASVSFVNANEEITLQDIANANASTIALIRSLEAEINFSAERLLPPKNPHQKVTSIYWAFDSMQERIIITNNKTKPRENGRTNDRIDIFRDGKKEKRLQNWDPLHPQIITPLDQGTVAAWIFPHHKRPRGMDPQEALMFVFTPDGLSLSELLQGKATDIKFNKKIINNNKECYQIHCSYRESGGIETILDFLIDPEINFLVRQMNSEIITKNQDGTQSSFFTQRTVTDFFLGNDGVCVPTSIKYESFSSPKQNHAESLGLVQIHLKKINQPLSTKAFDFIFPKDSLVSENPLIKGNVKVWLWGADNKPLREILSPDDLLLGDPTASPSQTRGNWVRLILILGGTILIIIAVIKILRNRKKRL